MENRIKWWIKNLIFRKSMLTIERGKTTEHWQLEGLLQTIVRDVEDLKNGK